jgi:integrase
MTRSYGAPVAAGANRRRKRQCAGIDELPSGALRVRVYAGMDPISKQRMYLSEVVPAGSRAGDQAERVRNRLQSQVDERRNLRTRATVGQLLDRWLDVLDVDPSTNVATSPRWVRTSDRCSDRCC